MVRKAKDVTDAELAVLQVLWNEGATSIQAVSDVLYPDDAEKKYSTVKRLLTRLETKGYVKRNSSGTLLTFEASRTRDDLVGQRLETLVETLCEGSLSPLLTHLSNVDRLTAKQQQTLKKMINDLKKRPSKKNK